MKRAENGRERNMRFGVACAGAVALSLVGGAAEAHHSFAMFDSTKKLTVSGTVKEFQWTNPHSYIQLVAKDSAGKDVEWSLEMGAPMYLYARGLRPSSLKAGMPLSITINPLRSGQPGGVVLDIKTPDGKLIGASLSRDPAKQ
jgi:hypothetical protein